MWLLFVDEILQDWEEITVRERQWVYFDDAPGLLDPEVTDGYVLLRDVSFRTMQLVLRLDVLRYSCLVSLDEGGRAEVQ